jgi:hypothetical protein
MTCPSTGGGWRGSGPGRSDLGWQCCCALRCPQTRRHRTSQLCHGACHPAAPPPCRGRSPRRGALRCGGGSRRDAGGPHPRRGAGGPRPRGAGGPRPRGAGGLRPPSSPCALAVTLVPATGPKAWRCGALLLTVSPVVHLFFDLVAGERTCDAAEHGADDAVAGLGPEGVAAKGSRRPGL